MADKNPDDRALERAVFRYRVIAEAIEARSKKGRTRIVRALAVREHAHPDGSLATISESTLWRWIRAFRKGGLLALQWARSHTLGICRAIPADILEAAFALRRENEDRPTKTIVDILVRQKRIQRDQLARSTLDRHLDHAGLSRRRLIRLGKKVYTRIETSAPFELVVADFHHGPYVRHGEDGSLRRALLCAFIDHFSRYVPEGRYYLHEDFAALRFGFRRLVVAYGLMEKLFADNGASFQSGRFHAACAALEITLVHSKPYVSESRGVIERFNRTIKEQFESEVRQREEPLTLDELNAYFEAWLAERYHRDTHSETGEAPALRFQMSAPLRAAPDLAHLEELLRLRARRKVHPKWSTVEVAGLRYQVSPGLRKRRVDVLHDPFAPEHVLIVFDGRVVERAFLQKPGQAPSLETSPAPTGERTDYLALLRTDHEKRVQAELCGLRLRKPSAPPEFTLTDLVGLLGRCRGAPLTDPERSEAGAFWRKMRPLGDGETRTVLEAITRRLGTGLHLRVYLDALSAHLLRARTNGDKKP